MFDVHNNLPLGPTAPLGEILLAETAIRIELPPSLHKLAVDRFHAVRKYIERDGSALCGKVRIFYPQGSMSIRATIRARKREDGFDIDIVAELILPASMTPAAVLDMLFEAINGEKGSLYYGKVERQTRCVTVYYDDGMHLDITPSVLLDQNDPRKSMIFHARPEESPAAHRWLPMNSYAFIELFNARAPIDLSFEEAYAKRAMAFDARMIKAEAEVKPVPAHSSTEGGKSSTVVALQLLKRNRNLRHRSRKGRRLPPSVMMAKIATEAAVPGNSISGALDAISAHILNTLEAAHARNDKVDVRNPKCLEERFTDRWPEDLDAQQTYIDDLKLFRRQLAALMSPALSLEEKGDLLVAMFGEGPARAVVKDYAGRLGAAVQGNTRTNASTGRVLTGTGVVPALIRPAAAQPRGHTFYGSRWRRK
jgi:hypothetical protein